MQEHWIPLLKIQGLIQLEPFISEFFLIIAAFIFYKFALKKISERRHVSLKQRFFATFIFLIISSVLAIFHWSFFENLKNMGQLQNLSTIYKIDAYLGLMTLIFAAITTIKLAQIYAYLYLFFMNMSMGVPRLLVNIFTIIFSLSLITWIASDIFGIHFGAVLTTSAIFSLVFGLALQETLGNLFSGLSLQIDRPFHIGDWIEVHSGTEKWIGMVQEISWRATTLSTFANEFILIPNRIMAGSHLINLSSGLKPVRLNHIFRFNFNVDIETARKALLKGVVGIPSILQDPAPRTLVTEITESWITIKIFYSLNDYALRHQVADVVISKIVKEIQNSKLNFATSVMNITSDQMTDKNDIL